MLDHTITIMQGPPEHVSNRIKPGQQCGPSNGVGILPEVSHNTATLNEIKYFIFLRSRYLLSPYIIVYMS